jgi:N-sulfoglucosamine sulfohydrolase
MTMTSTSSTPSISAGYHSVLAGIQHVAAKPETELGTSELLRPASMKAADVAPARCPVSKPRRLAGRFFWTSDSSRLIASIQPPTAADDPRYTQPPQPIPDTPATRRDMAAYHASARQMDQWRGPGVEMLWTAMASPPIRWSSAPPTTAFLFR